MGSPNDVTTKPAHPAADPGDPLWRALFDNSTVAIGIAALDGRIIATNTAFQRISGYTEAELRTMSIIDFTHPDDVGITRQAHQSLADGKTRYTLRKRSIRKDGRIIWTEASVAVVPTGPGKAPVMAGVIVDITEQREAEDALRLLVDVTAAASTAPDTGSMITACLRTICEARGWELGQAWLPDNHQLHCAPQWFARSAVANAFRDASCRLTFERGVGLPGRVWATGAPHWVADVRRDLNFPRNEAAHEGGFKGAFAFPVILGAEMLAVFEFFSHDVREPDPALLDAVQKLGLHLGEVLARRRQAETLHETQAVLARISRLSALGELTASIAHEVNQPLAAVVANASAARRWLAAAPPNLDEARAGLEHIIQNGNRASEVIQRVRRLLERGEPERHAVDLNDVVRDALQLIRPEAARHDVTLRVELMDEPLRVLGDRVELQQVFLNLTINSIEAMAGQDGPRRVLGVRSGRSAEPLEAWVIVFDTGPGLEPELLGRLFDVQFTTKPDGLGLGLPICRSIAEAHGGRLDLVDEPGARLALEVRIPALAGPTA
jgi:PAS domain S-box-containing protein